MEEVNDEMCIHALVCGFCGQYMDYPAFLHGKTDWRSPFRAMPSDTVLITATKTPELMRRIPIVTRHGNTRYRLRSIHSPGAFFRDSTTRIIHLVHDWCFSIARPDLGSASSVYHLLAASSVQSPLWDFREKALKSTPGSPLPYTDEVEKWINALVPDLSSKMAKLPTELRAKIWSFCDTSSLAYAAIASKSEPLRLMKSLQEPKDQFLSFKSGSIVIASRIKVFGESYLGNISIKTKGEHPDPRGQSLESIEIPTDAVQHIEFAVRYHGISALRLIGSSWRSQWIGNHSSADWYATVAGSTAACFINKLGCLDMLPSSDVKIWDLEGLGLKSLDNPYQIGNYVPFYHEGEHMDTIVMYSVTEGIAGIETYFSSHSALSGFRTGKAVAYSFSPSERIDAIWAYSCPPNYSSIIIRTTAGRQLSFGSLADPDFSKPGLQQLCLAADIRGLYHSRERPYQIVISWFALHTIGSNNQILEPERHPDPLRIRYETFNRTSAILNNITLIEACGSPGHIRGLRFRYSDGTRAILGQYSPNQWSCWTLFTDRDGPFRSISFNCTSTHEYDQDAGIVVRVETSTNLLQGNGVFTPGQDIVWWFSGLSNLIETYL